MKRIAIPAFGPISWRRYYSPGDWTAWALIDGSAEWHAQDTAQRNPRCYLFDSTVGWRRGAIRAGDKDIATVVSSSDDALLMATAPLMVECLVRIIRAHAAHDDAEIAHAVDEARTIVGRSWCFADVPRDLVKANVG